MQNLIEIKYGKSDIYPKIAINGEVISRYMSLSEYIYDDIFYWADRFYDIMDSELAEAYRVEITGCEYHEIVMKAAMSKSEYCEGVTRIAVAPRISLKDKYKFACEMNTKYGLLNRPVYESVDFACKDPSQFDSYQLEDVTFNTRSSEYCLATEDEDLSETVCKYFVIVSDKDRVERSRGTVYLYVTPDHLKSLISYLNEYHFLLPTINGVFNSANEKKLDEKIGLEFEAYSKEEYRLLFAPIPTQMDAGSAYTVQYEYFPKCFPAPNLKVLSDNVNVIGCKGNQLVAYDSGNCRVRFCDETGKEYYSATINVIKHNYITNIALVLPATFMNVDETLHFRCIFTPNDAEDIGEVKYRVSDPDVAAISEQNSLYALSAGRVRLTVSTPRLSKSVFVEVRPTVCGLVVSAEQIEMPFAAEADVSCSVVPYNAHPMPSVTWTSSASRIVSVKSTDGYHCVLEAKEFGTAYVTCAIEGTDITKVITVSVPKAKGCYVATSVYGSYDCPEVWTLRRYRDNYLANRWFGRLFIKCYYALSPRIVATFGKQKWFNRLFKRILDKKVDKLKKKGYEETPYNDLF